MKIFLVAAHKRIGAVSRGLFFSVAIILMQFVVVGGSFFHSARFLAYYSFVEEKLHNRDIDITHRDSLNCFVLQCMPTIANDLCCHTVALSLPLS